MSKSQHEIMGDEEEQKNFAEQLFDLLDNPELEEVFHWTPSGDAFCIRDQQAFESKVMAKHFPRSKFPSFTRRMRRWGFHRIKSSEQRNCGVFIFTCPRFRRDHPELCKTMFDDRQMKNKKPAFTGVNEPPSVGAAQNSTHGHSGHQLLVDGHSQTRAGSLPPGLLESALFFTRLGHHWNTTISQGRASAPVNTSPPLRFQRAPPHATATESFLNDVALAYQRHFPESDPTNMGRTITAASAFDHPQRAYQVPPANANANTGRDLEAIRADISKVEAELAVMSRMRVLREQSLSLAATRASIERRSSFQMTQGSQSAASERRSSSNP